MFLIIKMNNSHDTLLEKLKKYSDTPAYPFHMPGHKRLFGDDSLPYRIDITEIAGFDDLHDPTGIIKRIEQKIAEVFHSEHAFMLINGSTGGLLAAISAVTEIGDTIIVARNCHKSVYNAVMIRSLNAEYVYPPTDENGICGSIDPESVVDAINENPTAKAVVLTSPTYEGVVSDIASISKICHIKNIPLIVDGAHGAHLPFCSFGVKGEPIRSGADIVISSLHKTLPALTQTAAAFLNSKLVSCDEFRKYLEVYQTSSPSYPLMASVEICVDSVGTMDNEFAEYERRLNEFSEKMRQLQHLRLLCHHNSCYSYDKSKIVILTNRANINGTEIMRRLREEYQLELEMAYPTYAIAMTGVCDSEDGFLRLSDALFRIDKGLRYEEKPPFPPLPHPKKANRKDGEVGQQRSIYAYPPGIPIAAAGEIFGEAERRYVEELLLAGVTVRNA